MSLYKKWDEREAQHRTDRKKKKKEYEAAGSGRVFGDESTRAVSTQTTTYQKQQQLLLRYSQPTIAFVCVCVWLCVVSSRPCKTGEPNKNNAECMQYIRCEHKIHLNIYMKSIWDHIFFSFSPNVYCNDELLLLIRIPNAASQVRKTRV